MSDTSIYYTPTEIRSFLPGGWVLLDAVVEPTRRGADWATRVVDIADTEWSVEVGSAEIAKHGRLGALKLEIDRVYREALG